MIAEPTLSQVVERLRRLESALESLGIDVGVTTSTPALEYVIRVEGEEVWRGQDVATQYPLIRHQHANSEVSVGWDSTPFVLV